MEEKAERLRDRFSSQISAALSPEESRLFELIEQMANFSGVDCEPRVVGGWVRDRLMIAEAGKTAANEVDVVIKSLHPQQFAETVTRSLGLRPAYQRRNVVTWKLGEFSVDFVRLCDQHRALKPDAVTDVAADQCLDDPQLDALGRDFTINSLFFNLRLRRLEDYVGCGLADVQERRLQTPVDPLEALGADPLRALRALRFAVTRQLTIDERLWEALTHLDVHRPFISDDFARARIAPEIRKGFESADPSGFADLLCRSGLYQVAFPFARLHRISVDQLQLQKAQASVDTVLRVIAPDSRNWQTLVACLCTPLLEAQLTNDQLELFLEAMKSDFQFGQQAAGLLQVLVPAAASLNDAMFSDERKHELALWLRAWSAHWQLAICVFSAQRSLLTPEFMIDFVNRHDLLRVSQAQPLLTRVALIEHFPTLKPTDYHLIRDLLESLFSFHISSLAQGHPPTLQETHEFVEQSFRRLTSC